MFQAYSDLFTSDSFTLLFKFIYWTSFIWIPLFTFSVLLELWVRYVQAQFLAKQQYVLLEVKLPKDVFKSPHAAEFFINSMYQTSGEGNWFERYWNGGVRSWFSLEIVAKNGSVHFYIWTKVGHRNLIEANIYSQYPGIEIYEVPDYTLPVTYDPSQTSIWASEFDLTKDDVFPIKTYIDYGMDKNPEEEYKIDPLTPLIEFLGSIPRDSQVWIQILVRAHKAEEKDPKKSWGNAKIFQTFKPSDIWDRWEKKDLRWKEAAKVKVNEIVEGAKGEKGPDGKFVPGTGRQLTETERDTITALNRSVSKNGFDVGIRAVYLAPKESFSPSNIGGVINSITHFNSHLNGFKPARGVADRHSNFFLLWMKRSEKVVYEEKADLLDKYKRRAYYHKPHKSPHFILNSEELATIFHFPGGVLATPTFERVDSRKAEAPPNIPV
ncbi:MAG: hypothetical protein WAW92_03510 [Minisyncoccia bacterium]